MDRLFSVRIERLEQLRIHSCFEDDSSGSLMILSKKKTRQQILILSSVLKVITIEYTGLFYHALPHFHMRNNEKPPPLT